MSVMHIVGSASQLCDPEQSLNISGPPLPHVHNEKSEHIFIEGGLRRCSESAEHGSWHRG